MPTNPQLGPRGVPGQPPPDVALRLPRPGAYRKFIPTVGTLVVVALPGETARVPVQKVVDDDTILIKLDTPPMAKTHNFRFNDVIGVRRRVKDGRDIWEAQTDRDFLNEQARLMKVEEPEPAVEKVAVGAKAPVKPKVKKKPAAKRVGKGAKRRAA